MDADFGAARREEFEHGTLYIISTPIGNLRDITLRALDALQCVDLILAEDTRHSRKLLDCYNISTQISSYHDFNKEKRTPGIIARLQAGDKIGLISDAGTPGISDPGFYLIREALRQDLPVQALPGATAFVPALVLSGLPLHRFTFEGFPPQKKGRKTFFEALREEPRTMIFYEAPYRVLRTLKDVHRYLGNRNVAIARELTKKFEEIVREPVASAIEHFTAKAPKGEFVIIVEGALKNKRKGSSLAENRHTSR